MEGFGYKDGPMEWELLVEDRTQVRLILWTHGLVRVGAGMRRLRPDEAPLLFAPPPDDEEPSE